jgi:hypothetical protein
VKRSPELRAFLKLAAEEIEPHHYAGLEVEVAWLLQRTWRNYVLYSFAPYEKRRKPWVLPRDRLEAALSVLCEQRPLAELRAVVKNGKPAGKTRDLKSLVDVAVYRLLTVHDQKATDLASLLHCHRDTVYAMRLRGANSDKNPHMEGEILTLAELQTELRPVHEKLDRLAATQARISMEMVAISKRQPDDDLFVKEIDLLFASLGDELAKD